MSLTSHLSSARSPVRAFFEQRLGDTGPVVKEASAALRDGRKVAPLAASPGVDAGLAGTAIDFLLRFALAPDPCPRPGSAHHGASMIGNRLASTSGFEALTEALAFVATVGPYRREVTDGEWLALTQISLLLATFERVFRTKMLPPFIEQLDRVPTGWQAWAMLACADADVDDVANLARAAAQDHEDLRGRSLVCNPIFAQSLALGGADADLITDTGLLLDYKSTSTSRVCSRTDLWQLCGYALADTADEFGITSVGLSLLRWRSRATWPLDDLLGQLTGEPVERTRLRAEFAAMLGRDHGS